MGRATRAEPLFRFHGPWPRTAHSPFPCEWWLSPEHHWPTDECNGILPHPRNQGICFWGPSKKTQVSFSIFFLLCLLFSSIKKKKEKKKEGKKTSGWTGNLFSRWYFCSSWDPWSPHIPSHPPLPPTGAEWRSLVTWPYNCRPGHFLFLQKKKGLQLEGIEIGYAKASVHDQITQIKLVYDRISFCGAIMGYLNWNLLRNGHLSPTGN